MSNRQIYMLYDVESVCYPRGATLFLASPACSLIVRYVSTAVSAKYKHLQNHSNLFEREEKWFIASLPPPT